MSKDNVLEKFRENVRIKSLAIAQTEIIFEDLWKTNNMCTCVTNLPEGTSLDCEHFNSALDSVFKKEEDKLSTLGALLLLFRFTDRYRNYGE